MPSTFTTSNRFEQPGLLEQDGTWGNTLNTDLQLIDSAVSGYVAVALPDANYALSVASGAADESRMAIVHFTGTLTATRTITLPSVSKLRAVYNATTQSLTLTAGGTTFSLVAGRRALVYCDGANVYLVSSDTTDAATLQGQNGAFYRNASNLNAGTVPLTQLSVGTTSAVGVLQLTTGVSSTSTTTAAVPAAVKTANDAAAAAQTTANTGVANAASAQSTANTANSTANTALSNAATAQSSASAAQSSANAANSNASAAQTAANNAQAAANAAQATANSATASISTYAPRTARAYAHVLGSSGGAIIASSFGVASVTRSAQGQYRITFTSSGYGTGYCPMITPEAPSFLHTPVGYVAFNGATDGYVDIVLYNTAANALLDCTFNIVVMGAGG